MNTTRQRRRSWSRASAVLLAVATWTASAPAYAAEGSIDHVERQDDAIQVLYSLPGSAGVEPDLGSAAVTLNGEALAAEAELATDSRDTLRRTAVLAMDVSNSMRRENRIGEAKAAARAFLEAAPDDLYVGIVTFAGTVEVAQTPTLDREAAASVIDGLSLSRQTRLYDGLLQAVETVGGNGSRSVLVLSDGRDTSETQLETVTGRIGVSRVKVDVVALGLDENDTALLQQLAVAGEGNLISMDDPAALTEVFANEAEALASQVLLTVAPPPQGEPEEGTLAVSMTAGGVSYTDSAFVNVASAGEGDAAGPSTELIPVKPSGLQISRELMLGGILAAGLGFLVLIMSMLGVFGGRKETVEDRIAAYTRKGSRRIAAAQAQPGQQGVTASAVGVAEKALEGREGLVTTLESKLEAAGLSLKPAEWLLAHVAIAFVSGVLGLLLTSGNIIWTVVGLFFGAVLPWLYLSFKKARRVKAFKYSLADTLQLMSGSLSAGLSLAQAVDTVVREGQDPISGEFRRAIVEARLGVDIEDALDGVADRMQSVDFHWVVMAIRIQREVGGNLAELLNNVAATIREREYLERQVMALSAEGRLSVWILGGLPPGFLLYLLVANPTYLQPLITTAIGYVMLGVMAVLLVVGIFWMKKLVKVDV